MTIRHRKHSNSQPSQPRPMKLTARPCPTCGFDIYSPIGENWDCETCKLLAERTADPRIKQRESILTILRDEPVTKEQALEYYNQLAEIDQSLQFNPSDSLNDFIGANWSRMEEVPF
jgi:hypothetical protein